MPPGFIDSEREPICSPCTDRAQLVVADKLGAGLFAEGVRIADVVAVAVAGDDDVGLADLAELHLGGGIVVEPRVEIGGRLLGLEAKRGVADKGNFNRCHSMVLSFIS